MDIKLVVNGLDLSNRLATYSVDQEVKYRQIITTLDDKEHPVAGSTRNIVRFTLLPMTEEESNALETALSDLIFESTFTLHGQERTETVRLTTDLQNLFLLKSIDGKRRYRGGQIVLRGVNVARS